MSIYFKPWTCYLNCLWSATQVDRVCLAINSELLFFTNDITKSVCIKKWQKHSIAIELPIELPIGLPIVYWIAYWPRVRIAYGELLDTVSAVEAKGHNNAYSIPNKNASKGRKHIQQKTEDHKKNNNNNGKKEDVKILTHINRHMTKCLEPPQAK